MRRPRQVEIGAASRRASPPPISVARRVVGDQLAAEALEHAGRRQHDHDARSSRSRRRGRPRAPRPRAGCAAGEGDAPADAHSGRARDADRENLGRAVDHQPAGELEGRGPWRRTRRRTRPASCRCRGSAGPSARRSAKPSAKAKIAIWALCVNRKVANTPSPSVTLVVERFAKERLAEAVGSLPPASPSGMMLKYQLGSLRTSKKAATAAASREERRRTASRATGSAPRSGQPRTKNARDLANDRSLDAIDMEISARRTAARDKRAAPVERRVARDRERGQRGAVEAAGAQAGHRRSGVRNDRRSSRVTNSSRRCQSAACALRNRVALIERRIRSRGGAFTADSSA